MVTILIRTLIIYLLLILTMRFMGKRQLGELEVSELVTTLLLSEVASLPITNQDIPLAYALLPILTLTSLEVLLSGLLPEMPWLRRLLSDRPTILIRHGKPDRNAMMRSRISAEELMSQLRLKDVTDPGEVEYAVAEPNGQLSVILRASEQPATVRDVGADPTEAGIMHLIISDGRIDRHSLSLSGHDEAWLQGVLAAHAMRAEDVFMLLADDGGQVRILPGSAS